MVNKKIKRVPFGHPLFIVFSLFLLQPNLQAQKIDKHYTSSIQENGTLYFIKTIEGYKNAPKKTSLSFDITYLSSTDSAILNFTYLSNQISQIDSISFIHGNTSTNSVSSKLFIEAEKLNWEHRYSSKFSFSDIDLIFKSESPAKMRLFYENESMELVISEKTWSKKSEILRRIISMIKANN